jgi:acyl carrier protein
VTNEEIRAAVLRILTSIAPEARSLALRPSEKLRDQLDLDSMDVLNFVIALHEHLGVAIPESDYARLTTLDGIVAYLAARLAAGNTGVTDVSARSAQGGGVPR